MNVRTFSLFAAGCAFFQLTPNATFAADLEIACPPAAALYDKIYNCGGNSIASSYAMTCSNAISLSWNQAQKKVQTLLASNAKNSTHQQGSSEGNAGADYQNAMEILRSQINLMEIYTDRLADYTNSMVDLQTGVDDDSSLDCFSDAYHTIQNIIDQLYDQRENAIRTYMTATALGTTSDLFHANLVDTRPNTLLSATLGSGVDNKGLNQNQSNISAASAKAQAVVSPHGQGKITATGSQSARRTLTLTDTSASVSAGSGTISQTSYSPVSGVVTPTTNSGPSAQTNFSDPTQNSSLGSNQNPKNLDIAGSDIQSLSNYKDLLGIDANSTGSAKLENNARTIASSEQKSTKIGGSINPSRNENGNPTEAGLVANYPGDGSPASTPSVRMAQENAQNTFNSTAMNAGSDANASYSIFERVHKKIGLLAKQRKF